MAVIDGVRYVNDSQGTQPDAVIAALRAFDPPIVLIAGGRDKGIDLSGLGPIVAERAAAAIVIGESGPGLEHRFRAAGIERTERAGTLETAVRRAAAIAAELRDAAGRARPGRADRPAQSGRGKLRHVQGLRGARPGVQGCRGEPGRGGDPMTAAATR